MLNSVSAAKASSRPVPKVLLEAKKEATMQASGKEKPWDKGPWDKGHWANRNSDEHSHLPLDILRVSPILC